MAQGWNSFLSNQCLLYKVKKQNCHYGQLEICQNAAFGFERKQCSNNYRKAEPDAI